MASDDTDIDGSAGETGHSEATDDAPDPQRTATRPKWGLPERLSDTVPDRRAYGLERMTTSDEGGLLSPRERQYVQHAERLDPGDRDAVEEVVVERVDAFVETEWPLISESYPDVAAALRDTVCGDESD